MLSILGLAFATGQTTKIEKNIIYFKMLIFSLIHDGLGCAARHQGAKYCANLLPRWLNPLLDWRCFMSFNHIYHYGKLLTLT